MKKKFIKVLFCLLLIIIAVTHTYYLTHLYSHDEIWIYGFSANIVDGLIPYKDFNMVITPLFPYLLSIILNLFGKKLIIYHIVIAIMITTITLLASKKIKYYSLLIYISLLIYSLNGYNTSTLLWLFILLTIINKEDKYQDILIPIIVGIMILTKQTMVLLIIPSLIYSKNKKKTLLVYLSIILGFLAYTISQNNLMQFLDYCIFGMFDFAGHNSLSSPILIILEILMCIILILGIIQTKGKRQELLYVLLYQVMIIPILEIYHFVLGWSAFIYILFSTKQISKATKNTLFLFLIIIESTLIFTTNEMFTIRDKQYFENYPKEQSFMEGRMTTKITKNFVDGIQTFIQNYPDYNLYIFGNYSYIIKLELDIPINKYDLINNGNMGYKGEEKYIKEIDKKCSKEKCLFIIDENELTRQDYTQVNKKILNHVVNNTTKIYSSNTFGAYTN